MYELEYIRSFQICISVPLIYKFRDDLLGQRNQYTSALLDKTSIITTITHSHCKLLKTQKCLLPDLPGALGVPRPANNHTVMELHATGHGQYAKAHFDNFLRLSVCITPAYLRKYATITKKSISVDNPAMFMI